MSTGTTAEKQAFPGMPSLPKANLLFGPLHGCPAGFRPAGVREMANEGLCAAGPGVIPSVLSTTDRNFAYFKDLINAKVGGSSFTADSSPGIKDSLSPT